MKKTALIFTLVAALGLGSALTASAARVTVRVAPVVPIVPVGPRHHKVVREVGKGRVAKVFVERGRAHVIVDQRRGPSAHLILERGFRQARWLERGAFITFSGVRERGGVYVDAQIEQVRRPLW